MPLLIEADEKSFDNKQSNAQLQLNLEEIDWVQEIVLLN